MYAGVAAAVDHFAGLCGEAAGGRRDRLHRSMTAVAGYERELFAPLLDGLRAMRHVQVLGDPVRTTPTVSFTVSRLRPRQVAAELARRRVCAWDGDFGHQALFDAIGVNDAGGAVRLGLLHYNTLDEVEHVLDAVDSLARPRAAV